MRLLQRKATIKVAFISLLLLVSAPICADYYKYIGPGGEVLFTDQPMGKPFTLIWRKDQHFITMGDVGSVPASTSKVEIKSRSTKPEDSKVVSIQPKVDFNSMAVNRARFSDMIDEVALQERLYPSLLHAVVRVESAYDPEAVSPAGAIGLMQLMPHTARRFGVKDRRDPRANLEGGARYLRKLLTKYNNNIKLALAAYNAGHKAVKKYGNKIPPFPETQNYVKKVIEYYIQNRRQLAQVD